MSSRTRRRGLFLGLALAGATGCSAVVDFDQCSTDEDCKAGQLCDPQSHGCYDGEAAGGSGGQGAGGEATGGTGGQGAGGAVNPGGKAFGKACQRDAECASSFCSPKDARCTRECAQDTDCPGEASLVQCADGACAFNIASALPEPVKVGFLYVGPVADFGWTKTHDDGRKALERFFKDKGIAVETTFEPAVAPDAAPGVIDNMLANDVDVVVGTSFDFVPALQEASGAHPQARFLSCSGFVTADEKDKNLGSYFGKMQQAVYLAGKMAAKASKTKVIGVIGSVPIPELVRHINAFAIGARQEVPDIEVQVRWVDAFFAPDKEEAAAEELIAAGADVVWSSTDTQIAMQVAERSQTAAGDPVYALGNDNPNACDFAPDICITTPYWNWGPVLIQQVQGMLDGTWDYRNVIWEGIKGDSEESMVYLAPVNGEILPNAALDVEPLIQRMAQGALDPFDGPLNDNTGRERVAAGDRTSDSEALSMCWFAEGIFEPGTGHVPAVVPPLCDGTR